MYFRRDLDFDDLIETIDQLADEEIDKVVDWQMTTSPAAKTERTGDAQPTPLLGTAWASRIAESAASAMSELLAASQVPPAQVGYTMEQLIEMRNQAWRNGNRDAALGLERRIQDQSRPLRRTVLQPRGDIVLAPSASDMPVWSVDTLQDGSRFDRVNYRQISYAVDTMDEPIMNVLHVRMWWGETGATDRQYQQSAVSREAVQDLRAPVPLLRAAIDTERSIIVALDPRRVNNIAVYMESP